MEFQPVRFEIVFHGCGAGFHLNLNTKLTETKANKDYFSYGSAVT